MPGQRHSQPTPTSLGQRCMPVLLHFRQDDRGLLRATAATRGWKITREEKIPANLCRDSNSQPLDQESGALPTSYPGSPVYQDLEAGVDLKCAALYLLQF